MICLCCIILAAIVDPPQTTLDPNTDDQPVQFNLTPLPDTATPLPASNTPQPTATVPPLPTALPTNTPIPANTPTPLPPPATFTPYPCNCAADTYNCSHGEVARLCFQQCFPTAGDIHRLDADGDGRVCER